MPLEELAIMQLPESASLIQRKHRCPSVVLGRCAATDIPRNPFISCAPACSPDAAETIRYTWNQLARSAGKWVKGLGSSLSLWERQMERERTDNIQRREGRAPSRCGLRNESTVAGSIFLSLRFFVTRVALCVSHPSPLSPSAFRILAVVFQPFCFCFCFPAVFTPFARFALCLFSRAPTGCLSSLFRSSRLMEAHGATGRGDEVARKHAGALDCGGRDLTALSRSVERPQLNRGNYICEHLFCFSDPRRGYLRSARNEQDRLRSYFARFLFYSSLLLPGFMYVVRAVL